MTVNPTTIDQVVAGIQFFDRPDTWTAFGPLLKFADRPEPSDEDDEPWTWPWGFHTLARDDLDDVDMIACRGFPTRREAKAARDQAIADTREHTNGVTAWVADCDEATWAVILAFTGWADTTNTEF